MAVLLCGAMDIAFSPPNRPTGDLFASARGSPQRLRRGHATNHHGRLQHDIDLDVALSESDEQLLDGEATPPGLHPPDPSLAATSRHNRLSLDSSQTESPGHRRHVHTVIATRFRHSTHLTTPGTIRELLDGQKAHY